MFVVGLIVVKSSHARTSFRDTEEPTLVRNVSSVPNVSRDSCEAIIFRSISKRIYLVSDAEVAIPPMNYNSILYKSRSNNSSRTKKQISA